VYCCAVSGEQPGGGACRAISSSPGRNILREKSSQNLYDQSYTRHNVRVVSVEILRPSSSDGLRMTPLN
jgi:hypothetical protein